MCTVAGAPAAAMASQSSTARLQAAAGGGGGGGGDYKERRAAWLPPARRLGDPSPDWTAGGAGRAATAVHRRADRALAVPASGPRQEPAIRVGAGNLQRPGAPTDSPCAIASASSDVTEPKPRAPIAVTPHRSHPHRDRRRAPSTPAPANMLRATARLAPRLFPRAEAALGTRGMTMQGLKGAPGRPRRRVLPRPLRQAPGTPADAPPRCPACRLRRPRGRRGGAPAAGSGAGPLVGGGGADPPPSSAFAGLHC